MKSPFLLHTCDIVYLEVFLYWRRTPREAFCQCQGATGNTCHFHQGQKHLKLMGAWVEDGSIYTMRA